MRQIPKVTLTWLLWSVVGLFAVTVLAWLLGVDPLAAGNWSGRANAALHPWRMPLMVLRWALWCLLFIGWQWIGRRLFRGHADTAQAQRQQWQSLRPRLLGGIVLVELLILLSYLTGG